MLPISGAKVAPHRGKHLRIVVHDQENGLVHDLTPAASDSDIGSTTRNSVRPGRDSTVISPSLWRTRRRTMSRPRPVPWPIGLVVTKGSKIRPRISSGTPLTLATRGTTTR